MSTSCIAAVSSVAPSSSPRTMNRRYSRLRGRPSSNTTIEATTSVPCTWRDVEALDAQRRLVAARAPPAAPASAWLRVVRSPARVSLVQGQGLLGVAGDRLHQRPLVAALRHPQRRPGAPRSPRSHCVERLGVGRAAPGTSTSRGHRRRRPRRRRPAGAEVLDQVAGGRRPRPCSTTQPRWPRTRPPRTWKTWTAASSSSSARANTSASVPSPSTTACFSIARSQRADVVAQPGRPLEVQLGRRPPSSRARAGATKRVGLAGHEVAEVLDDARGAPRRRPGRRRAPSTCRCSRAGTGRPTWPARLNTPARAGAHREHPQQQVERLADRPGVRVGAEVAHALALGAAHHLQPRELLAQRDGEVRVGLVVAVLDVEARVELLDPGVLQLQRLDLGGDDGPLDAGARW